MSERELLEKEMYDLLSELRNTTSEFGDWKVIKSYEYYLAGVEIPYDFDELHAQREAKRARIDEIKELLKNMPEENA